MDGQYGHAFVDVLSMLRRGTALIELDDELERLVEAVEETGKAGTLTLKLKITPKKHDSKVLELADTVLVTAPKPDVATTTAWVSADGRLTRRDPRQPELPVPTEVPRDAQAG